MPGRTRDLVCPPAKRAARVLGREDCADVAEVDVLGHGDAEAQLRDEVVSIELAQGWTLVDRHGGRLEECRRHRRARLEGAPPHRLVKRLGRHGVELGASWPRQRGFERLVDAGSECRASKAAERLGRRGCRV